MTVPARLGLLQATVAIVSTILTTALRIDLPAGGEQCFFEELAEGAVVEGSFLVVKGRHKDLDVNVRDPSGLELYNANHQEEGRFEIEAQTHGTYTFCFSNRASMVGHRVADIQLVTESPVNVSLLAQKETLDRAEKLVEHVGQLARKIEFQQTYQKHLRNSHLEVVTSVRLRVWVWTFATTLLASILSLSQSYIVLRIVMRYKKLRKRPPV